MKSKLVFISLIALSALGKENKKNETISLNFINEPIVNIINKLSAIKNVNIILPMPKDSAGPIPSYGSISTTSKDFFDIKVNFYKEETVTIDEAWNLLTNFLNVSGFSIFKRDDNYQIKQLADVNKAPLPLYVDVPLDKLPDNNEQIRYIYYFKKINIYNKSGTTITNLRNMLNNMLVGASQKSSPATFAPSGSLGDGSSSASNIFELNSTHNCLVIANPSSQIKAVLQIIKRLDKKGANETVEVVHLNYAQPSYVEKLLTQLIQNIEDDPFVRFGAPSPAKEKPEALFSSNTRVVAMDRINAVTIIGSKNSIEKVSKFIKTNLDLPISEGLSLIHVKPIQYLKSSDLVGPLKSILKNQAQQQSNSAFGGYSQSSQTSSPDSMFSDVIITSEIEQTAQAQNQNQPQNETSWGQQTPTNAAPIVGGNNLIIAAKEREWLIINRLIEQLDKPQLQVAIETLIVDITITDDKLIASQIRNPVNVSKPGDLNWQATPAGSIGSASSSSLVTSRTFDGETYKTIGADLGQQVLNLSDGSQAYLAKAVSETIIGKGSTILTFGDKESGISAIMQVLDKQGNTTILSQPFVITTNNQQANITSSDIRWVDGDANQTASSNGNVIINKVQIDAKLEVDITPRINKNGQDINLELKITANEFAGENNNKLTRKILTNAHMQNKQVLVLGGLTRAGETDSEIGVPLLSKLPLVGNLFKKRSKRKDKKMLMIFISPTIIKPQTDGKIDLYTTKKINYVIDSLTESSREIYGDNFDNLADPITRIFFQPDNKSFKEEITNYSKTGIFSVKEKKY